MSLFKNLKHKYYDFKTNMRYKRFKHCSIPYLFHNKKRNTLEWVTFNNETHEYEIYNQLQNALEDQVYCGFIYHYKARIYGRENSNQELKYRLMVSHCHSFDEVIETLYRYPESFEIPKEFLYEYSEQELQFLKQIQNYLNLIELKDEKINEERLELGQKYENIYQKKHKSIIDKLTLKYYDKKEQKIMNKESFTRYENEKAQEYSKYRVAHFTDMNIAKAIVEGKKDYMIKGQYSFSSSPLNEKWLIVSDNSYLGIVEVIQEDILQFKDLKENMINYKLCDCKNFNDYKKKLFQDLRENSLAMNESFTKESLVKYLKLKVIKKF